MNNEEKILQMLEALTEKVGNLETGLKDVKHEVVKTNLTIENEIKPNIQIIKEGHQGLVEKLNNMNEKIEDIEESVIVLKVLQVKK